MQPLPTGNINSGYFMNTESIDIKSLAIADLEKLITEYPWFSYARMELFLRLAENGLDFTMEQLKSCSAFLPSLQSIYYKAAESDKNSLDIPVIDFNEINREIVVNKAENEVVDSNPAKNETRYILVGGDYFTKEDLESVDGGQSFSIGRFGSVEDSEYVENEKVVGEENSDVPDGFYTETLARIYAEQGYYEEAMKVYAKLILLYPEKSAYFATLVKKVKSKNN